MDIWAVVRSKRKGGLNKASESSGVRSAPRHAGFREGLSPSRSWRLGFMSNSCAKPQPLSVEFLKLFFIHITIHCSPDSLAVTTNKGSGSVITI